MIVFRSSARGLRPAVDLSAEKSSSSGHKSIWLVVGACEQAKQEVLSPLSTISYRSLGYFSFQSGSSKLRKAGQGSWKGEKASVQRASASTEKTKGLDIALFPLWLSKTRRTGVQGKGHPGAAGIGAAGRVRTSARRRCGRLRS